jgi:hypothetical protein
MTLMDRADAIARKTQDAYSCERYTEAGWRDCTLVCLKHGCSDAETEEVLRSKWVRWATEATGRSWGDCVGTDLERFLKQEAKDSRMTIKAIATRLLATGN